MSAQDFVEWYQALGVDPAFISLNKYMIGYDGKSAKAMARQAVLTAAMQKNLSPNRSAFSRANNGKVSPSDCEHILYLAVQTGVVAQNDVQSWADTNLGVDCTGFAVAYYASLNKIDINKYNGGASCPYLLMHAKSAQSGAASNGTGAGPLIWALADVRPDDMILWMKSDGIETRKPGHISIISSVDLNTGTLTCGESSGESDGQGHSGPRLKQRVWDLDSNDDSSKNRKYISLNHSDHVIIVRPPAQFG